MKSITTKTYGHKVLSAFLAVLMSLSVFSSAFTAEAANKWKTGCFARGAYTSGTMVVLKNTKKDAKVKLHTYKKNWKGVGVDCKCTVDIIMKDGNGRIVWQGTKNVGKSGLTLKLGKDHSMYRLYFKVHGLTSPKYVNNVADYWGIEYTSNCS